MTTPGFSQTLSGYYGVPAGLIALADRVERGLVELFGVFDQLAKVNQARVLGAFGRHQVAASHLSGSTGYGYHDLGRERAGLVFADVFGTEAALVSPHFLSGTHALATCLWGVLRPGDTMLSLTGPPYKTLEAVIGTRRSRGSLAEYGISYRQVAWPPPDGELDEALASSPRLVYLQRSPGYSSRPALGIEQMRRLIERVRAQAPGAVVMVDNCYGEFVEPVEPGHAGADLLAGSLIKNPGGGLADGGGYVAGSSALVEAVAERLSSPGQGSHVGAAPAGYRSTLQGLFMAPAVVSGALKGAALAAGLFGALGFETAPGPLDQRHDIIQAIHLGSAQALEAFCRGIQKASPVDAQATPVPWQMPGYDCQVIMAGGTFVQGSSIELSADAPFSEPFTVYLQGGLSYHHVYCAVLVAANELLQAGCLA
ncbi:MAG: methionine gamma-lyase family protein [Bacillota bacterium]